MKSRELLFRGMAVAGLGLLSACYPDINDVIALKCNANPESVIQEKLELLTGQTISLDGREHNITVEGSGRLSFQKKVVTQGDDILYGSGSDRTFKVKGAAGEGDKTVVTITFNCADPKNP